MKIIFLLFTLLPIISHAQVWSDDMDLNQTSPTIYYDSTQSKYGYQKNGKVVIQPKFEDGYNFHDKKFASVKKNGKWGIINQKGKFKITPKFTLLSPVINGQYLAEKDDVFYWKTLKGKTVITDKYFKIDLLKLKPYIEKSKIPDKNLLVRLIDLITTSPLNCEPTEEDIIKTQHPFSLILIQYYYFTKLFLNGELS